MKKFLTWMSTYGPALIPCGGLALVVAGIAMNVCDAIVGGLVLSSLLSFGEAITYSMLAGLSAKPDHARPYSFMAGANWTTTIVLAMLLLATLGFWTPIPAITHVENGLLPRSYERSQALGEIEVLKRARRAGNQAMVDTDTKIAPDLTSADGENGQAM